MFVWPHHPRCCCDWILTGHGPMTHASTHTKSLLPDVPLKVGTLAKRTGVSVRTLHHYDEIGLLSPSARTGAGHRLYDTNDIHRLQQIQSLRMMGLSLEEIHEALRAPEYSARQIVQLQLRRLTHQIALQQRLAQRLRLLAQHMDTSTHVSVEELCRIVKETTVMDKYFTPEQLAAMQTRGDALGAEGVQQVQQRWAEIIPAVRAHMTKNTPVTDPTLQALGREWRDLVNAFTGGDREVARLSRTMISTETLGAKDAHGPMPDPEMFAYMGRVFAEIGGGPG